MLRYGVREFVQGKSRSEIDQLIDSIRSTQAGASNHAANSLFLERIGLRLLDTRNEAYQNDALHFHLALLYAYMNEPERAAEHMARSNSLPAASADLLYSDHLRESLELRQRQEAARARGMPPLLIAAMPRSASTTLAHTLSQHFDMPELRLSLARVSLVPSWVKLFADGGALTHDHFEASDFNLKVLGDCGIRDVFVQIRDPRAAAASVINLKASHAQRQTGTQMPPEQFEREVLDIFSGGFVRWLHDWLSCASQPPAGLRVHWIMSSDVRNRTVEVVSDICERLKPAYPALSEYSDRAPTVVTANLVSGDDDAWRARISASGQQRMWDMISPEAVSLLDLRR